MHSGPHFKLLSDGNHKYNSLSNEPYYWEYKKMMKKVLGIGGSPRKGGNSDILLKHIIKGVSNEGVATKEIQLRDYQ